LQDLQAGIDEHAGRSGAIDRDAVGLALGIELAAETLRRFSRPFPRWKQRSNLSGLAA